jgi:hypothetical protein
VVIIDACRNEPAAPTRAAAPRAMPQGFARSLRNVRQGFLLLSSCSAGQVSYEDPRLGHGVFFDSILRGLTGAADRQAEGLPGNGDGRVEAQELFQYAAAQTKRHVQETFSGSQTPETFSRYSEPVFLTEVDKLPARVDVPVPDIVQDVLRRTLPERDRLHQVFALAKIAERQAEADDLASALTTLDEAMKLAEQFEPGKPMTERVYPHDSVRDQAIEKMAQSAANIGEFRLAMDTMRRILHWPRRVDALCYIANVAAEKNGIDFAQGLLAERSEYFFDNYKEARLRERSIRSTAGGGSQLTRRPKTAPRYPGPTRRAR